MEEPAGEQQVAILFADVSGFTQLQGSELTAFVDNFLTPFANTLGNRVRVSNTWGDAIFLIFYTAREAADCALALRDFIRFTPWHEKGIHKELRIRIALHNASAIFITDPITKRRNAYGPHINMAARLEPITMPNEVFMTEGFKVALSSFQTANAYDWDDIGILALAKDWGPSQVYRLRRPTEQSLPPQKLTKPIERFTKSSQTHLPAELGVTTLTGNATRKRDKIFISYSHKDRKLFDEFKTMLAPAMRTGIVDPWDDNKIAPGAKWREEIQAAIQAAKVAVLLVSENFLASDFIAKDELPPLLKSAQENGVTVLWIYLSDCLYRGTEIADYQAAHDVSRPLSMLYRPQRQAVLREICERLIQIAQGQ